MSTETIEFDSIEHVLWKRLTNCESEAKRRGLAFDLDISFLNSLICPTCPVADIDLDWSFSEYRRNDYPTLVRIDLNKGFTKDNMIFVSYLAKKIRAKFLSLTQPFNE